ncbi:MAG: neutral/alkaline non-lysosomal ceramidase N-terminal domain-containing protein, partial [Phycisphaerales bacterium]
MRKVSLFILDRIIVILVVTAIWLFYPGLSVTAQGKSGESSSILQAGTAKVDITPEKPVKMAGYASRKELSTGVHDPLSARAIAFENNGKRLVLVSADIIGFYGKTGNHLRNVILDEFQLEPSELFLSAIHTHSGPIMTIDKENGHPNNLEYTEGLKDKLIEVIRKALDNTEPVNIGTGVGYSPVGINRRELQFDSEGNSSVRLGRNPYGTTDKDVLVLKMAKPNGQTVAALFDYATHATCLGGKNYVISGDVLGLAEQFVEKIL